MADPSNLADTDALLRAIADSTTDIVFVRDLEGRYILANSAAARANGVTVDALIGSDDSLLFPPDVVREIRADDRRTLDEGVTRTFERTLQPRGESRTYQVIKGPCRDREGNVMGVFVISRDITEHKQAEDERARMLERERSLREEADRARIVAERATKALRALDQITEAALSSLALDDLLRTLVARIKEAFEVDTVALVLLDEEGKQLVLRAAEGLGAALDENLHFASERGVAGQILSARRPIIIDEVDPADLATPHLHDLGVRSLMGAALRRPDRALGVIHVGSLVPRHFSEDEATLLMAAADRMAVALENARLYDQSRRANLARDQVLSVVAHDLRNPLNSIALQAQLMASRMTRAQAAPETHLQSVHAILASAKLMARLVQDLLDVTRIEAGELSLAVAPLAVEPLVSDAVELVLPLASEKSLRLETRLATDLAEISGDRHRLLQVLGNLLGNAIKFTAEGGVITVGVEQLGADVQISVADTGPGIRAEHLPHVFDRYWRGGASDGQGAGLGLAIAQGIVRGHGGRIWAESSFGAGSTFFVAIPRAD